MPATFSLATPDVDTIVNDLINKHYPPLEDVGVTFDLIFAFGPRNKHGQLKSPAMQTRGFACAAQVRINPVKARVAGRRDVEITIDGDGWDSWSDERKRAVLDHELSHIGVVVGQTDCALRPKLELLPHDFECCGFRTIIERHGREALESQQIEQTVRSCGQKEFAFE